VCPSSSSSSHFVYLFRTFCGKYQHEAQAGLHFVCWPYCDIPNTVSLRVQQLNVQCDTKTHDNVTVQINVAVQYQVRPEKVYDAFYKLTDAKVQIRAYIEDVVRSKIPEMTLDQAYEEKNTVAQNVKETLDAVMDEYGYQIQQALVTDLTPDNRVQLAMNEIDANRRLKEAATEKAEADKVMLVKAAEADAESKYLSGVGIARQRKAIVDGLRDSVLEFSGNVPGTGPQDVINLLMITQYFDMLKDVGNNPTPTTIFVPSTPAGVSNIQKEIGAALSMPAPHAMGSGERK